MPRVTSTILEHEGQSYLDVTSYADDGSVLYSHQVWVDNIPSLHSLLQDMPWFLNRTTGHLACQSARGAILAAFEEQGQVPAQFSLGRAIAALKAMGSGRKIRRVYAEPTDARADSVGVDYEPLHLPVVLASAPPAAAALIVPEYTPGTSLAAQRRAEADRRRAEADERRTIAEQRAIKRHFDRMTAENERKRAKAAREARRRDKISGKALAHACRLQAEEMLFAALERGEPWATDMQRVRAGHRATNNIQAPAEYVRLNAGLPLLVSEDEAATDDAERYQASVAHFEEFCAGFRQKLSRAALRGSWLKVHPEHDWVAWRDVAEVPSASRYAPAITAPRPAAALLPAPKTPEQVRAEFETAWSFGNTGGGLPPDQIAHWNMLFAAAAEPEVTARLRVEYTEATKQHAWATWQKEHT